jgi:hypothetical protein
MLLIRSMGGREALGGRDGSWEGAQLVWRGITVARGLRVLTVDQRYWLD